MRPIAQPVAPSGVENAYPGRDGAMTWNAWPLGRVDQRLDQLQELGDRAREAVRDQQRLRVRPVGPDVQEVDALAVDLGDELGVLVELRLLGAPVVPGAPVLGELLQVAQRYPAGPLDAGQLAGPAGVGEPVVQVVEVGLGDLDAEGLDRRRSSWFSLSGQRGASASTKNARDNRGRFRS